MKNLPINLNQSIVDMIREYAESKDASLKFSDIARTNVGISWLHYKILNICQKENWSDYSMALPHIEEELM